MLKRYVGASLAVAVALSAMVAPLAAQEKGQRASKAASPAVTAMRERQKKCGAEWKQAKAAGKVEKGMKWPKYWSACNKRLKAAGG